MYYVTADQVAEEIDAAQQATTQPAPEGKRVVHQLVVETEVADGIELHRATCVCGWRHKHRFVNTKMGAQDVYVGHLQTEGITA